MKRTRAAAALVALAAAATSASASAAPAELGLNVHQSKDTGVDVASGAGLKWARIDVDWYGIETAAGVYDWSVIDALVDRATSKGLSVLAVLSYTPAWASQGDAKGGGTLNDVPKAGTYASFVTAAVNRYKSKVTHYELWNEPNLQQFFEGTPADYVSRVLVPGADALHAACPACLVLGPGLATVGGEYATWMDVVFPAAASKIDVVTGHVYAGFPGPAGSSGPGVTSDSFFNKLESHRVVKVGGTTVYEGPLSFKEEMDKHGVKKPFWLTETGLEATSGNAKEEAAQVDYYKKTLEAMLTRPWWTATIFYEAFDEPGQPYRWGVVRRDPAAASGYVPKASYGFLSKVRASSPYFGGSKTDCDDGLDNDGDGATDFPADTTCASAGAPSEGKPVGPDAGASSSSSGASGSSGVGDDGGASSGFVDPGERPPSDDSGCSASPRAGVGEGVLVGALALALGLALRRRRG